MTLSSPLIPTITTQPDFGGKMLLKYTLPTGVVIYSPNTTVKTKNAEVFITKNEHERPNLNIKEVRPKIYKRNEYNAV